MTPFQQIAQPTSRRLRYRLASVVLLCVAINGLGAFSVQAAESVPAVLPTKCVTTVTKKLYADYTTRLLKDTAPYAGKDAYAKAIQAYQYELNISWEAMQQPYCGYGTPGLASSIKSFKKTVERARTAFLAAIKNAPKVSLTPASAGASTTTVATAPATVPLSVTAPVSVPAVPKPEASLPLVVRGLSQGTHSTAVLALQKRLLRYFKLPIDTNSATGFFGPKTRELVIKFQLEKKLITSRTADGAGMIGPRTAAALNAL